MEDKKYLWITPLLLLVMIGGGQFLLTPTIEGYDVCRQGNQYGTWSNISETIYINDNLSALGYYTCSLEKSNKWCGKVSGSRCYYVMEENKSSGYEFMLKPIITGKGELKEFHNVFEPAKTKLKDINVEDIIPKNKTNLDWSNIEKMSDVELNTYLLDKGTYLKHDEQLDEVLIMYDNKIKGFENLIDIAIYQEEKDELSIELERLKEKNKAVLMEKQIRDVEAFYRNPVGTTYYIDCDAGNDSAAGTAIGTAWKTPYKYTTSTVRTEGDIGIIRANTTCLQVTSLVFDEDGDQDAYISLIGANTSNDPWSDGLNIKPTIDFQGSGASYVYLGYDGYWRFSNLHFRDGASSLGIVRISSSSYPYFENCIFNNSMSNTIGLTVYSSIAKFSNNIIHGGTSSDVGLRSNYAHVFSYNNIYKGSWGMDTQNGGIIYSFNDDVSGVGSSEFISAYMGQIYIENSIINITDGHTIAAAPGAIVCADSRDGELFGGFCETYDAIYTNTATTVHSGGSGRSLRMELDEGNVRNNNTYFKEYLYQINVYGTYKVYVPASETTISMWAQIQNWSVIPGVNDFYLQGRYLDSSTITHRASAKSLQTISANDVWHEFNITITPSQAGFVYLNFVLNAAEDEGAIYIDTKPVVS